MTDHRRSVTAFAPASVSNVACGFDIMGFALEGLGDEVTVTTVPTPGITISMFPQGGTELPADPARNTAGPPVAALLKHTGATCGAAVTIRKGVRAGGGLGSSAASAVAAAAAANVLFHAGLSPRQLLPYALEGEIAASGALHADNVAPSLLGGFIVVRGYDPLDIIPLPTPVELWCAVILPECEIETRISRALLPACVPLRDVVTQTGNAAGLVAGLLQQDFALIGRSLQDVIAEPARAHTIPAFPELKEAALRAGALGCSISGSGPAVFALTRGEKICRQVEDAMGDALVRAGVPFTTHCSRVNSHGAAVIREETHAPV